VNSNRRLGIALIALSVAIVTGLVGCDGSDPTPIPVPPTPALDSPAGSTVVATLPAAGARVSWSPYGRYLRVATSEGSIVYDRFGRMVSQFHGLVDWLDESHVLGPDGIARAVTESQGFGYVPNAWVVANGHGTGIVVVGVPGCVGDPIVAWYRNGSFDLAQPETFSPLGYSPDGDLALEGRMACSSGDAELHGWKGDVDVVELATGRTISTLHGIRGPMAFDPGGKSLAAQSDADLVIATGGESEIDTLPGVRLLAWLDEVRLALAGDGHQIVNVLARPEVEPGAADAFGIRSPANVPPGEAPTLQVSWTGRVLEVDGPDGRIIDLSSRGLTIALNPTPGQNDMAATGLQPDYWSPDGGMLALPTADGTSIVLVSVDPANPAKAYASTTSPSN
jgi:hypothetical protein